MSKNSPNGSTAKWRRVRAAQLRRRPTCEARGCHRRATEVDHVVPLARGGSRFDPTNLRSYCHSCHVERHHPPRHPIDPLTGMPSDPSHWWNAE